MGNNGHHATQAGAHLVGQPVTTSNEFIPVSCTLTCNCLIAKGFKTGTAMQSRNSEPVTCPHCRHTYVAMMPLTPGTALPITRLPPMTIPELLARLQDPAPLEGPERRRVIACAPAECRFVRSETDGELDRDSMIAALELYREEHP